MAQCSATDGEDFESKVPVHITLSYGMSLTKLRADQDIRNIKAELVEQYDFDYNIQLMITEQFKLSVIADKDDTRRLN